jgi:hypothetical protein
VLHMYNNRASETAKQDVTCGIGILLINRDTAIGPDYKFMFYDPATNRQPTDELPTSGKHCSTSILPELQRNRTLPVRPRPRTRDMNGFS